jgi:protein gp37
METSTMSQNSTIEWTEKTWNPVRGCDKISPGCKHCYAATFAERFRAVAGNAYEQGFDLRLAPDQLPKPFSWQPSTVFVNSMSDLFHKDVPDGYIEKISRVMGLADWHTYQVLTKRAERMREALEGGSVLGNVWLGVSVEDRRYGVPRIEHLRNTPAAVRFLSVEPLLEDLGVLDLRGIDWVIVGGESGPGCRPMDEAWVRNIHIQCVQQDVAFFFKQWGGYPKKKAGRMLAGRTWDDMPPRARADYPGRRIAGERRAAACP